MQYLDSEIEHSVSQCIWQQMFQGRIKIWKNEADDNENLRC